MSKVTSQGLIIVCLFLITWQLLKQIDWMEVIGVEALTEKTEEKLGELYWDLFKTEGRENTDGALHIRIDSLIEKICVHNQINKTDIKLHILEKDEVNAFALPDGHLVLFTGLIDFVENQDELSGVLAHEMAHIELNHVSQKLIKEVGLNTLISITTGGAGAEIIKETAFLLSSTAFDRGMEKEADLQAVTYMINAGMRAESFADLLSRMGEDDHRATRYLSWISTHPDPNERAAYILAFLK